MSYPIHYVYAGDVLPVFFSTYGKTNGESITMTGLAVTDIEIYKDGSATQRASDAGYTLLDTDGIDFDAITGIHGFSIDTGDNTDAGFYTVGAWFHVVISAVTVDSQTVNFVAAAFRLMPAETVAGKPKVDTDTFGGTAGTFSSGRPEVNTTHAAGTAWNSAAIGAATLASDTITAAKIAADAITAAKIAAGAIDRDTFAADTGLQSARSNTAQAGAATTITLDASAAATNDYYNGAFILLTGSTGQGQGRFITDYDGTTKVATVDPAWAVNPTSSTTFAIIPGGFIDVAGAVWNAARASYTTAGTFGQGAASVQGNVTGNVSGNVVGDVQGSVSVGDMQPAALAEVNAEVDTALADIHLDHLIASADPGSIVANSSFLAKLVSKSATPAFSSYDNTTDSLEAARDNIGTATNLGGGATVAANLSDIEAQTDDIGAAGAGLTAVPWNAAWDAEVQSEVDDAIVARFLDKLVLLSGTADSGSTTTMVDAALTQGDADYWKGRLIVFTSGTLAGQCAIITDFAPGTDTVTFSPGLTQAVSTHTYVILPGVSVWDDAMAEHLLAGTTGNILNAGSTLDAAGVRTAVGLASANLDTQLDALPTATENADALLKRDWTAVTGEAARSVLNALRHIRNKWSISGTTLTVTKEDDTTAAWTSSLTTTSSANSVTGSDPA